MRPALASPGAASAADYAPSESLVEQNICTEQRTGSLPLRVLPRWGAARGPPRCREAGGAAPTPADTPATRRQGIVFPLGDKTARAWRAPSLGGRIP